MFVWRSNLLGSSGKGHEYFLKHLLGTKHGVMGKDLGEDGKKKPIEVEVARRGAGRKARPAGDARLPHVDHLRLFRHRAADRDLVREERPQHLRHASLHPSADGGGRPGLGVAQRLGDLQGHRRRRSREVAPEVLGVEKDVVLTPIMHDTPGEIAQPFDVKDWKKGEIDPIPGKTMPAVTVVERDYPNLYKRFTSLGPLMDKLGNGGKGMGWNTEHEVELLKKLNGVVTEEGATKGLAAHRHRHRRLRSDPDAGAGDQRRSRGQGLGVARKTSPGATTPISRSRRKTRRSASATSSRSRARSSPRRSGRASRCEKVCYNAGYTNVHELIPWRTLTGRQQLYQDHLWMRAFGEGFCVYRPPIDTKTVKPVIDRKPNGKPRSC